MTFPKLPPHLKEKALTAVKEKPVSTSVAGASLLAAAVLGGSILFSTPAETVVQLQAIRADAVVAQDALGDVIGGIDDLIADNNTTTSTTAAPTTTTTAPTTTSTAPPTTTTTVAPTTTTTTTPSPTTTTTTTIPPGPTTGERWTFLISGKLNTAGQPSVKEPWWEPDYFRVLPYAPNTGWTDGDRENYYCGYGFLMNNGIPVGRVTAYAIEAARGNPNDPNSDTIVISDRSMDEAVRLLDGSLAQPPNQVELAEPCNSLIGTPDYPDLIGSGERPTVEFVYNGQTIEFRNYKPLVVPPFLQFQVTTANEHQVVVVAYKNGVASVAFYYDSMVPAMVMETDFADCLGCG